MNLGLEGRTCAVTGASRGIGRETARQLCAEGANVLLVARSADRLEEAARECSAGGGKAETLVLDVTERDAGDRILVASESGFGALDVLVNSAATPCQLCWRCASSRVETTCRMIACDTHSRFKWAAAQSMC